MKHGVNANVGKWASMPVGECERAEKIPYNLGVIYSGHQKSLANPRSPIRSLEIRVVCTKQSTLNSKYVHAPPHAHLPYSLS